jgi:hypothetical protein
VPQEYFLLLNFVLKWAVNNKDTMEIILTILIPNGTCALNLISRQLEKVGSQKILFLSFLSLPASK